MNSEEKPTPRQELEDLLEKQGGNSLENCNLEFLGYQQGLKGEMPRQDLAHLAAYKKGYLSALNYLRQLFFSSALLPSAILFQSSIISQVLLSIMSIEYLIGGNFATLLVERTPPSSYQAQILFQDCSLFPPQELYTNLSVALEVGLDRTLLFQSNRPSASA